MNKTCMSKEKYLKRISAKSSLKMHKSSNSTDHMSKTFMNNHSQSQSITQIKTQINQHLSHTTTIIMFRQCSLKKTQYSTHSTRSQSCLTSWKLLFNFKASKTWSFMRMSLLSLKISYKTKNLSNSLLNTKLSLKS